MIINHETEKTMLKNVSGDQETVRFKLGAAESQSAALPQSYRASSVDVIIIEFQLSELSYSYDFVVIKIIHVF